LAKAKKCGTLKLEQNVEIITTGRELEVYQRRGVGGLKKTGRRIPKDSVVELVDRKRSLFKGQAINFIGLRGGGERQKFYVLESEFNSK